jgi:hypothetical protein
VDSKDFSVGKLFSTQTPPYFAPLSQSFEGRPSFIVH